MNSWQLWREDKHAVARKLEEGRDLDGHNSAFGDNDLIIGFLMVEGFWSVLVETGFLLNAGTWTRWRRVTAPLFEPG